MVMSPVSRETFLHNALFYSALSSLRPDDKIVLIRMPKEMCASDLDGQSLKCFDSEKGEKEDEKVIGNISVNLKSKNKSFPRSSSNKSTSVSSAYTIKSSRRNLKVNSLAITSPSASSSTSLASTQQMRLGRQFDEFWNVNLGVEVEATPIKKISKIVKKRAEAPLVEQPRNLRMRLLPFSTPNYQ